MAPINHEMFRYLLPQYCANPPKDRYPAQQQQESVQDIIIVEATKDPAHITDKNTTGEAVPDKAIQILSVGSNDDSSKQTFSLLTRCILNNQYFKAPATTTENDSSGSGSDDDYDEEEFLSYYYRHYEHFYNDKDYASVTRYHLKKYNLKPTRVHNTTLMEAPILVHNTSNTSLFPFFILLRAKWRRYWRTSGKTATGNPPKGN
jgi:hypothetical protein